MSPLVLSHPEAITWLFVKQPQPTRQIQELLKYMAESLELETSTILDKTHQPLNIHESKEKKQIHSISAELLDPSEDTLLTPTHLKRKVIFIN
ncbi:unnamed protein product [Caretta caretta]